MSNSSIWPIYRTLSGTTTSGQKEPGNDSNEGLFRILKSTGITEALPSYCLMPYIYGLFNVEIW